MYFDPPGANLVAPAICIWLSASSLQLLELARFSDDPNPAVTRVLFTENDLHGRK